MDKEARAAHTERRSKVNRARLDVLEVSLALFMVQVSLDAAKSVEEKVRTIAEVPISHDDPVDREIAALANDAGIRFSEMLSVWIAKAEREGRGG